MKFSLSRLAGHLEERIKDYLLTAYLTKDHLFNKKREELIQDRQIGPMFREPLFEIQDRYPGSGHDLSSFIEKEKTFKGVTEIDILSSFLKKVAPHELYKHQINSIRTIQDTDKHLVVTTGTGSGKTLSFVIPTILSILNESLGGNGGIPWSAAKLPLNKWWDQKKPRFVQARQHNSRPPALRALFMYPLNALVQDQIKNLREILNSSEAEAVYDNLLGGERIYFGQYNSSTPGHGFSSDPKRIESCVEILREIQRQTVDVDEDHQHLIERIGTSELLTRWDMQVTPPDILITNYSMLAVMLVREIEQQMFEQTKIWLKSNPKNQFFLVIDELHSYRGTPGTEISYILKSFLGRIGLTPTHPQLRIIATSASLESEADSQVDHPFLSDFFGTPKDKQYFNVISGPTVKPRLDTPSKISSCKDIFSEYLSNIDDPQSFDQVGMKIKKQLAHEDGSLSSILNSAGVEDALLIARKEVCDQIDDNLIHHPPLTYQQIANNLFEGNLDSAKGLIEFITSEKEELKDLNIKMRMHLFVRNLTGISRTMKFVNGNLTPPILYEKGVSICPKEHVICMECCYCQECGEIYYTSFKRDHKHRGVVSTFISPEIPSGSKVHDLFQVLFYFGDDDDSISRSNLDWKRGKLNAVTGEYSASPVFEGSGDGWYIETPFNDPPK